MAAWFQVTLLVRGADRLRAILKSKMYQLSNEDSILEQTAKEREERRARGAQRAVEAQRSSGEATRCVQKADCDKLAVGAVL
jgi:hypothetical protein